MYHVFQSFKKEDQENLKETAERIKNKTYQEYLDFANSPEGKEQRYLSSLPKYSYGKDGERLDKQEFIPFTVINKKPRFTACDNVPEKEQFNCFKEKLDAHVRATFKYPEEAQDAGIQGRVYINFRINTDGSVTILNTRAPSPILDAEGRRIIESLPTLIPGKDASGTPKPVTFAYPIVFKLNADDTNNSQ
ncbi:energy transducer TonB [Joostella sp. CR20]